MKTLIIDPDSDRVVVKSVELLYVQFTCPCCGTHYVASDPGFIPNCYNCGSVMQKE